MEAFLPDRKAQKGGYQEFQELKLGKKTIDPGGQAKGGAMDAISRRLATMKGK